MGMAGLKGKPADPEKAARDFIKTYTNVLSSEKKLEGAFYEAHDENLGRWGLLSMKLHAYTAAMDPTGGFEMSDKDASAANEMLGNFKRGPYLIEARTIMLLAAQIMPLLEEGEAFEII